MLLCWGACVNMQNSEVGLLLSCVQKSYVESNLGQLMVLGKAALQLVCNEIQCMKKGFAMHHYRVVASDTAS